MWKKTIIFTLFCVSCFGTRAQSITPPTVDVVAVTNTSIRVAADDPLGREIRLVLVEVAGGTPQMSPWWTPPREVTIPDLWPATNYDITVLARNAGGEIEDAAAVQQATRIFSLNAQKMPTVATIMDASFARHLCAIAAASPEATVDEAVVAAGRIVLEERRAAVEAEIAQMVDRVGTLEDD